MREKGPHRASGLYAHLTWHTWRRQPAIREGDVATIGAAVLAAGGRTRIRVHAQAVLSDHVHVLVSYSPDASLAAFVREAKSESARRLNHTRPERLQFRWCRGYCAGSLSREHVDATRLYLGRQHTHHPDKVPL